MGSATSASCRASSSSLIRSACDIKRRAPHRAGALDSSRDTFAPQRRNVDYLLPPFLAALSSPPVPALPWPAGLRASPFLEPVLMPVVVPDFILLDFIR
jgi:hypothetical protein